MRKRSPGVLLATFVVAATLVSCGGGANRAVESQPDLAAIADTLRAMGEADQANRENIPRAIAENDTAFLFRQIREDSARTRQLAQIIARIGWPKRTEVGDRAAEAAWLVLQHSPDNEFQQRMVPELESAAARGDVVPANMATFSDRMLVRAGQPQRYGTSFSMRDGRLVPDPIAPSSNLDSLRATAGLPSMDDYVAALRETYGVDVEWP